MTTGWLPGYGPTAQEIADFENWRRKEFPTVAEKRADVAAAAAAIEAASHPPEPDELDASDAFATSDEAAALTASESALAAARVDAAVTAKRVQRLEQSLHDLQATQADELTERGALHGRIQKAVELAAHAGSREVVSSHLTRDEGGRINGVVQFLADGMTRKGTVVRDAQGRPVEVTYELA